VAVTLPAGADEAEPLCPIQQASESVAAETRLSRSLLRAARGRGEPVIATNRSAGGGMVAEAEIELSIAAAGGTTMAAVAVPLDPTKGAAAGLLYATFPPEYGTGEWLALCALAVRQHRQAEAVWAHIAADRKLAALEADLERARRVQDRLVPRSCALPGLDVAIRFRPCLGVAGDYVDALPLPDGRSLLVVADVSGKGLPAALVAMGLHTLVHAAARRWVDLADLATALDAHLVESLPPESFVTLIALTVDPSTGAVEAVNAGHPAAAAFGPGGAFRSLPPDGDMMLGPFPQALAVQPDQLAAGETLLLFTDGCFEVFDAAGRMLGPDDLCRLSAGRIASAPDAATAADAVVALLDDWQGTGEASDDRTLLLVRRRLADSVSN
jgi:sigma-B regulation protein RsbU (phosphoserine phosphatase)